MHILVFIIISSFSITLIALLGIFFLFLRKRLLDKIVVYLVAFTAGSLMGGAFLHLLPEGAQALPPDIFFPLLLLSFILFFFIEELFRWHHCHKAGCPQHSFGYINLLGDGVHNFIDGLIIAATFLVNVRLGLITTLAVALHEVPQEIGDFGVLIYAGFKRGRALFLNFLAAVMVVLGGFFGYSLSLRVESAVPYLLPFAAGSFIYLATSDLIPEIKKEKKIKKSLLLFFFFLLGILIMYLLKFIG